jgi:hypothetical protein
MGQRYIDWLPSYAADHFLFVMVTIALLLTLCQFLADDLISLWCHHRTAVFIAVLGVGIALTGGMGVETLGYKVFQGHTESIWYKVEVAVEELMEMFGGTLVLIAALEMRRSKVSLRSPERVSDMRFDVRHAQ